MTTTASSTASTQLVYKRIAKSRSKVHGDTNVGEPFATGIHFPLVINGTLNPLGLVDIWNGGFAGANVTLRDGIRTLRNENVSFVVQI